MKKTLFITLILALVVILAAQTLPVDSRRKVMQFERNFELLKYGPPADTLWRSVPVPPRTSSITILPATGAIGIAQDSLYAVSGVAYSKYINLPANTAYTLPAIGVSKIWLRRSAAGTASIANIVFRKM